jgi:hypothetical protein
LGDDVALQFHGKTSMLAEVRPRVERTLAAAVEGHEVSYQTLH